MWFVIADAASNPSMAIARKPSGGKPTTTAMAETPAVEKSFKTLTFGPWLK